MPFGPRFAVAVATLLLVAPGAHADGAVPPPRHRLAVAANTAGLRFYRAGQLPRAALRFRDATQLDPDYALAHYNLACAASRLRDVSTAVGELRWLAASRDEVAQAKLAKAAVDADLDFVSALPAVREILGLAAFDAEQPLAWLAERHGTWSAELPTATCVARSYRFVFRADGDARLTVSEACDGAPLHAWTFAGKTTRASDGSVAITVTDWSRWPDGVALTFGACPGLDGAAACFTLSTADSELGPFHRGVAGTSPMRSGTPKTVAAASR